MIQLQSYKLICFGKFTAALTEKVIYKRKSQLRVRMITEMIKFNAKALKNTLFLLQIESFSTSLKILSKITCFQPNELALLPALLL